MITIKDVADETFIETLYNLNIYNDINEICIKYGVTPVTQLLRKKNWPNLAKARHETWMFMRDRFQMSYSAIGELFHRDHSTILVGIRQARKKLGNLYGAGTKAKMMQEMFDAMGKLQ